MESATWGRRQAVPVVCVLLFKKMQQYIYIYMYTCYLLVTSMAKLLKVPSFEISVHACVCVCVCVCVSVFELHQILWLAYSRYTDVYMIHQWMKIELVTPSV